MQPHYKRRLIKFFRILKPTLKVGIFILAIFFIWKGLSTTLAFVRENNLSRNFFATILFNKEPPLEKYEGRTNLIILGIAGGSHDGADLTDAIIFLSIDYQKKDVLEVSIPRDIWSTSLKDKINTAYHYGEEKKKGGGLILAKSEVEAVVGQPVHYAYLLDFSGFQKLIDLGGGVDIEVQNSFTDNYYPIPGRENDTCSGDPTFSCRYEKLQFTKGVQHMDGERALKYVRSRQAEGEEGTDFARGRRQLQLISALKYKILQPSYILQNLSHMKEMAKAFDDATDTDLKLTEQIMFLKSFATLSDQQIRKKALDSGNEEKNIKGFLVNPPLWQYSGEWVLIPRTGEGNFDEIQKYIACNIEDVNCPIQP